jgi:hypothetical protein
MSFSDPEKKAEYARYNAMRARCTNPNNNAYANYGGRGISVCDRWLFGADGRTGFDCYLEDMGRRPAGMTLERVDNNKGYGPDNCKWATVTEQHDNMRTLRMVTAFGITKPLAKWARERQMEKATLKRRIQRGWTPEEAVTAPVR